MRLIPAHNATEQRKARARPSGQNDYWRIASFAKRYRNGEITAEDVPPDERDDVMIYLLAHPRRKAIA